MHTWYVRGVLRKFPVLGGFENLFRAIKFNFVGGWWGVAKKSIKIATNSCKA